MARQGGKHELRARDAREREVDKLMTKLRGGLIQMALKADTSQSPEEIRDKMIEAHLPLIDEAGKQGVQVLCMQEVFGDVTF